MLASRTIPIRRLFLWSLLLVMIPTTVLVSYWGANGLRTAMIESYLRDARNTQLLRAKSVISYIHETASDTTTIAQSEGIIGYLTERRNANLKVSDDLMHYLTTHVTNKGHLNLYLITPEGRVVYANSKAERWLGEYIFNIDLGGGDLSELYEELEQLERGEVAIDYLYGRYVDQYIGAFASKVIDQFGQAQGFVLTLTGADGLAKELATDIRFADKEINYIFEADDEQLTLVTPVDHWNGNQFSSGYVPIHYPQYWIDAANQTGSSSQSVYEDSNGNPALVVYNKLDIAGLNWHLVSISGDNSFLRAFNDVLLWVVGFAGVIGIGAFVLFSFLSRMFIRELRLTEAFAQKVQNKQFDHSLAESWILEVTALSHSMNDMAKQISVDDWVKSGRLQLEEQTREARGLEQLGDQLLVFLADYMQLNTGGIYLYDEAQQDLALVSQFAFTPAERHYSTEIGVIGQAWRNNAMQVLTRDDNIDQLFSYEIAGERVNLCHALVIPVYLQSQKLGVMVLGFLRTVPQYIQDFIVSLMPLIAVKFSEQYRGEQIQRLLKQAQHRQAELAEANEKLLALSSYDEMTGMYNKRKGRELLKDCWQSAAQFEQPLSIIVFDIDHFKRYNDSFGHAKGDVCIRDVCEAARSINLRESDFFIRFGGEEFVLIMPNARLEVATRAAYAIREKVEKLRILHSEEVESEFVTVSIGGTSVYPRFDSKYEAAFEKADNNLYCAKQSGRNCVCVE